MKRIDKYSQCPCDSKQPYAKCCRPYHQGTPAPTAQSLMRSRYSAYALDLSSYIIATTHRQNSSYKEDIEAWRGELDAFSTQTSFDGLKVTGGEESGTTATVSFTAYLRQGGADATFSEKSSFEKVGDNWLYLRGESEN